jgi:hypothetical protein
MTNNELLDQRWQQLLQPDTRKRHKGSEIRYITRHQLAEFMTEAALLAIGAAGLSEPVTPAGPVNALLQSLKVLAEAAEDGHMGWSVIARGARSCIERTIKDVTRFLEYPGLLVKHPSVEVDLAVTRLRFHEDGRVRCICAATEGAPAQFEFWLHELNPAGPVDDAVRIMVAGMSRAVVEDMIAQLVTKGALNQLPGEGGVLEPVAYLRDLDGSGSFHPCAKDDPGAFPVFGNPSGKLGAGGVVNPDTVHHLQAHPEYVMAPGSAHAMPAEASLDFCRGCETPENERVNLPEDWKAGDPLPEGLTVHYTSREGGPFAFLGNPREGTRERVYFGIEAATLETANAEMRPRGEGDLCPGCHLPLSICSCAEAG